MDFRIPLFYNPHFFMTVFFLYRHLPSFTVIHHSLTHNHNRCVLTYI